MWGNAHLAHLDKIPCALPNCTSSAAQSAWYHASGDKILHFNLRKNVHFTPACRLDGTPGRNRTCDPLFRRQLLYPLSYEGVSLDSTKPLSG